MTGFPAKWRQRWFRRWLVARVFWLFGQRENAREDSEDILWDDPDQDRWSEITRIMIKDSSVHLIYIWSELSRITDPDPDQPQISTAEILRFRLYCACLSCQTEVKSSRTFNDELWFLVKYWKRKKKIQILQRVLTRLESTRFNYSSWPLLFVLLWVESNPKSTVAHNYHNYHGKIKTLWQKQQHHGKSENLTSKTKTSRQNQILHSKNQIPHQKSKYPRQNQSYFAFAVKYLVLRWGILFLPWGFWFCRDSYGPLYKCFYYVVW